MSIDYGNIPLFNQLSRLDRSRLIPHYTTIVYDAGETIVKQGAVGDCLYLIVSGTVTVVFTPPDGAALEITTIGEGECFGEMALLTGEPRAADVIASGSPTVVLRLTRERFISLLGTHNSLAVRFASVLAERVRKTNQKFAAGGVSETSMKTLDRDLELADSLPTSAGLRAGWSLGFHLRSRRTISLLLATVLISIALFLLKDSGLSHQQTVFFTLLLGATVVWSFDAFSYHVVALALPLAAVLLGAAKPAEAFAGFSHPSWFLVLGVFAISAAISHTGLMYRLVLLIVSRFPVSYRWQSFSLAAAGLILTPVIPSSNGRAVLAGPLATSLSEILRLRSGSAGSIGMALAALLGFGHMSFLFMNGTATCLLAFGLLPADSAAGITWSSWFLIALPMGLIFFATSFASILIQYPSSHEVPATSDLLPAQLRALGPWEPEEVLTCIIVAFSLAGFMTQSWHHINGAWVALASFFLLFGFGVLNERSVRSNIDWNFLLSFGALVGFGGLIANSGLGSVMANRMAPVLNHVQGSPFLFLASISLGMYLLRMFLPLAAAQLVVLLSVLPMVKEAGVAPFIVCLVVIISSNPWFFPYQNSIYLNLLEATEGKLFDHHQTRKAAWAHVVSVFVAIQASIPYWQWLGMIR
jgi:branched-chain amino acid transport system substrate-binding protein